VPQVSEQTDDSEQRGAPPSVSAPDALNQQLRRAEQVIRRKAFGVTASVVLRSGFDREGAGDWQQSLCFGKHNGEWQLYLQAGLSDHPESLARGDLFSSDLETRVLAAERMPALVAALATVEVESREEAVSAAARELSRFTDRLERAPI
jgi:hypothetical protein